MSTYAIVNFGMTLRKPQENYLWSDFYVLRCGYQP